MAKYIKKRINIAFIALLLLFFIALAYIYILVQHSQRLIIGASITDVYISIDFLKTNTIYIGLAVLLVALIIWYLVVRAIRKPFRKITELFHELDEGNFPEMEMDSPDSSESEMMRTINRFIKRLKRTTDFAISLNSGEFKTNFEAVGPKDQLGNVLLHLREKLLFDEIQREDPQEDESEEVKIHKEKLEQQNQQIEEYFKQLSDSIKYAKKIQDAFLPQKEEINKLFPRNFIFYKPKEIVSGDYYWLEKIEDKIYFAAVDCFGQGVPGAFMTVVVAGILKQALFFTSERKSSSILNYLDRELKNILENQPEDIFAVDGVNVSLCTLNTKNLELEFSGASSPILIRRKNDLVELEGNTKPIGQSASGHLDMELYHDEKIQLKKGEMIYLFSDGYFTQQNNRKKPYGYSRFKESLFEIAVLPMDEQKEKISYTLIDWMREEEQGDDIMLIGIKV